jgi:uncharacterized protein with PIN domain
MATPRIVVDTMLGRLARWLRALGCDTLYPGQADDRALLRLARAEGRVLVTRDRMLARVAEPLGCLIRSDGLDAQIREAVERLGLTPRQEEWLSRCLDCNGALAPCDREAVAGRVPQHVLATQAAFVGCPGCGKVYWAGTHADRILERLARLVGPAGRA